MSIIGLLEYFPIEHNSMVFLGVWNKPSDTDSKEIIVQQKESEFCGQNTCVWIMILLFNRHEIIWLEIIYLIFLICWFNCKMENTLYHAGWLCVLKTLTGSFLFHYSFCVIFTESRVIMMFQQHLNIFPLAIPVQITAKLAWHVFWCHGHLTFCRLLAT